MGVQSIDAEDDQFAYRYDTQLLIERRDEDLDEDDIADYITEHFEGNSLIAAGDEDLVKIHFHTNEPWKILEYCNSVGEIFDIVVEDMIQHNQDVVVIVDEAYIDFGGDTAKELTRKYDNVLVVQTYSKSRSLAGLRIGYAIGNKELIKAMNDVKYSYNSYTMNEPSIVLGTAVLEDEEYFQETRNKIIDTREWFQIEMRKIGFSFADSKANFIFATHESVPAKEIFEAAKKAKIYVRYFDQPRINNYLRITIGTRDEMETLLDFLKEFTATK